MKSRQPGSSHCVFKMLRSVISPPPTRLLSSVRTGSGSWRVSTTGCRGLETRWISFAIGARNSLRKLPGSSSMLLNSITSVLVSRTSVHTSTKSVSTLGKPDVSSPRSFVSMCRVMFADAFS